MMKKFVLYSLCFLIVLGLVLYVLKITAPDPKFNEASFESEPLQSALLAPDLGWTLAQTMGEKGEPRTLVVTEFDADTITAVDLQRIGAIQSDNPFVVLKSITQDRLFLAFENTNLHIQLPFSQLFSVAGNGRRHLATGTNFPEHAEEAASDSVFHFPKFGLATPARTSVDWIPNGLLDYEVELCARFDRPIASVADFDAATKGFFLCGDFTERGKLLRLIDPQNLDSGRGFSDGKSGKGFFPAGALLVIPNDWRSFIANERMMTHVNGQPRQDARGGEMILDFRQLTERVLADMTTPRFLYAGNYEKLAPNQQIDLDMVLMSGTSEGVIFTMPTRADLINGLYRYLKQGAFFSKQGLYNTMVESFIESEIDSQHFLQPGDTVEFSASSLGNIVVKVRQDN